MGRIAVMDFRVCSGERERFLQLAPKSARLSLERERGCQRFDVRANRDGPNGFFLYEIYSSRAALDTHLQAEHVRAFFSEVEEGRHIEDGAGSRTRGIPPAPRFHNVTRRMGQNV